MKFKVGDRVKSIYSDDINLVGYVIECTKGEYRNSYKIDFGINAPKDVAHCWDGQYNTYAEDNLELYEEPKKEITWRDFEAGDELLIRTRYNGYIWCTMKEMLFNNNGVYVNEYIQNETGTQLWYLEEVDWNKSWERKQEKLGNPLYYASLPENTNCTIKLQNADSIDVSTGNITNNLKNKTNKINTNNMNLREKIQFALTNEPLKTLIKNDVRNQDGTLTSQGQGMFQDFLEAKFREEFDTKTITDIKALEEEENKTKKK